MKHTRLFLVLLTCVYLFRLSSSFPRKSLQLGDTKADHKMSRLPPKARATSTKGEENKNIETTPSITASGTKKAGDWNARKALEVTVYLGLWYYLSGWYNIYNKQALTNLKLPWFVATGELYMYFLPRIHSQFTHLEMIVLLVQMACGFIVFLPLWALKLRDRPAASPKDFMDICSFLSPVALYQSLTHAAGVIALGAGAVSFTQGE